MLPNISVQTVWRTYIIKVDERFHTVKREEQNVHSLTSFKMTFNFAEIWKTLFVLFMNVSC